MKNILFLLIILSSCTGKKDNINKERIIMLKKEISMQKSLNDSLLHHKNLTIDIIDSLKTKTSNHYLNKETANSFLKTEMRFFTTNDDLTVTVFDNFFNDEGCFWLLLANSYIIMPKGNIEISSEVSYLNYLWNWYDRDEESIRFFFTKERMDFICSLFKNNNYYIDSGLKNSIESLLLAYEEIGGNEDVLHELYTKSLNNEGGLVVENITSDKMLLLLQVKKHCNYDDGNEGSINQKIFRAYSFWGRRNHENNKEIIYKLLKYFYKNVHINEKSSENIPKEEGEGYEEEEDYDTGYRTLDDLAITNYKEPNQTEMDTAVNSKLQILPSTGYNLEKLKEIYQIRFPPSKPMKLRNILSEMKGGFDGTKNVNYVNSGGWKNNSDFTVEIPTHNVYYVYISSTNIIYQQPVYKNKNSEILEPNEQMPYDDDDVKIIEEKQVVINGRDNNNNKTYSEIFHPDMSEGKYLYFVKVITEKGNVFFSEIQILNCIRSK